MSQHFDHAHAHLGKAAAIGLDAAPSTLNSAALRSLAHAAWSQCSSIGIDEVTLASARHVIDALTHQPSRHLAAMLDRSATFKAAHAFTEAVGRRLNPVQRLYPDEYARSTRRSRLGSVFRKQPEQSAKAAERSLALNSNRAPMPTLIQARVLVIGNLRKPEFASLSREQRECLRQAVFDVLQPSSPRGDKETACRHWPGDAPPGERLLDLCAFARVSEDLERPLQDLLGLLREDLRKVLNHPPPTPAEILREAATASMTVLEDRRTLIPKVRQALAQPNREALVGGCAAVLAVVMEANASHRGSLTEADVLEGAMHLLASVEVAEPEVTKRLPHALRKLPVEMALEVYRHLDAEALAAVFRTKWHDEGFRLSAWTQLHPAQRREFARTAPLQFHLLAETVTDAARPIGERLVDQAHTPAELLACVKQAEASGTFAAYARSDVGIGSSIGSSLPSMQTYVGHACTWLDKAATAARVRSDLQAQFLKKSIQVSSLVASAHWRSMGRGNVSEKRERAEQIRPYRISLLAHADRILASSPDQPELLAFMGDHADTLRTDDPLRKALYGRLAEVFLTKNLKDPDSVTGAAAHVLWAAGHGDLENRRAVLERLSTVLENGELMDRGRYAPSALARLAIGLEDDWWREEAEVKLAATAMAELSQRLRADQLYYVGGYVIRALGSTITSPLSEVRDLFMPTLRSLLRHELSPEDYCLGILVLARGAHTMPWNGIVALQERMLRSIRGREVPRQHHRLAVADVRAFEAAVRGAASPELLERVRAVRAGLEALEVAA